MSATNDLPDAAPARRVRGLDRHRLLALIVALSVQLALVAVAVNGQLTARLTGEEYLLRVAPVDPHDPFRGAYVALDYPDLLPADRDGMRAPERRDGEDRDLFVPLERDGAVWVGGTASRERPVDGPYLRCAADYGWDLSCGIESLFLPGDRALELERAVADEEMVARVRIDSRGNAALLDVLPADGN